MIYAQGLLDLHDELIVDLFAGGGGASCGIEMGLRRMVDVAVNHNPAAVAMHRVNHPQTRHYTSDVFEVCPREVTQGRKVGLLWLSPDCTFFSKSRGGKPIRDANRKRRALAWIALRWAGQVRPRVIMLENVEEFAEWCPLVAKRDKETGRVLRAVTYLDDDGKEKTKEIPVEPGERLPVDEQLLIPDKRRRGKTFRRWVRSLEDLGYTVEWRELRACDYGAPTTRNRLFVIARCDGRPIVWPKPTHGDPKSKAVLKGDVSGRKLKPWRAVAECIDWTIPIPSIFLTKAEAKAWGKAHGQRPPKRPLVEATCRRVARGTMKYVVNAADPFVVTLAHGETSPSGAQRWGSGVRGTDEPLGTILTSGNGAIVAPQVAHLTHQGDRRTHPATEPAPTITGANRGELAVLAPSVVPVQNASSGDVAHPADEPLRTITAKPKGGGFAVVAATMVQTGYGEREGQAPRALDVQAPLGTIVGTQKHAVVAAHLETYYGEKREGDVRGAALDEPLRTQTTENRHALVAAHIQRDFGASVGQEATDPLGAVTAGGGGKAAVVATFLAQHNTDRGGAAKAGRPTDAPISTITTSGSHQQLVAASLVKLRGTSTDAPADEPVHTISAQGQHHAIIAAHLEALYSAKGDESRAAPPDEPVHTITASPRHALVAAHLTHNYTSNTSGGEGDPALPLKTITTGGHAGLVYAFLCKYYGTATGQDPREPLHTLTTGDRFGIVTVGGQTFVIVDLGMRMFQPRELYSAQGFPRTYVIDYGITETGERIEFTKTEQVEMVGNSVPPQFSAALTRANLPEMIVPRKEKAAA